MIEKNEYYGLEKTAEDFAKHIHIISGLHVGIHDLRRTHMISAGDNIVNICAYCKRKSLKFSDQCRCNDRDFLNYSSKKREPTVYYCHLGLCEAIIPIIDGDNTVGVIFLGQALIPEISPTLEEIYSTLSKLDPTHFSRDNKKDIEQAYNNTQIITREKMDSLISLSEFIAQSIYVNRWLNFNSVTTEKNFQYYMREAIDLIHVPLSTFSVEKIADELNISYSQLNRLSNKIFNMPLKQYALNLKIKTAARLLTEHPDMSVSDIAATVGIDNTHYFSRIFSEKIGTSCTEYRIKQKNTAE